MSGTRHFSYETAAAEFEIPERWLRTHIKDLPHRKFGRYVRFSESDLMAISNMHIATDPITAAATAEPVTVMPDIRPSSARRRSAHPAATG